jgi:hypothetical protein
MSQIQVNSSSSPSPPSGTVVQQIYVENTTQDVSLLPYANNGPNILSITLTPHSASNILICQFDICFDGPPAVVSYQMYAGLTQDLTNTFYQTGGGTLGLQSGNFTDSLTGYVQIAAGTTSATTIALLAGGSSTQTTLLNPSGVFTGTGPISSLTITEVTP